MIRILFTCVAAFLFVPPANAHWGHVGELAGHGHLIGIGALAAAAALAAVLAKPKSEKIDEEVAEESDEEAAGETA